MLTHVLRASSREGYVQLLDLKSGKTEEVFIGDVASTLASVAEVRPAAEPPSQKWVSLIAA